MPSGQLDSCESMMKRLLSLVAALLVATGVGAQYRTPLEDLDDSETVRALKEHVAYLSGAQMEGRKAGSEGERMAAEYLAGKLKEYGIDVLTAGSEFKIAHGADTLISRNVIGLLQGWDKSQNGHYIVVGARMDNLGMDQFTVDGELVNRTYYGANGNASGMAMMLELAQKLSYARTLLRRSILFVGFGASCDSFAGSWYFLNRSFVSDAENIDAMVNLDMLGLVQNGFQAYTASNQDLDAVIQSLQGELLPIQAQAVPQEPYPGDHVVFYSKEIPSVLFTTGRYSEHGTGRDTYSIINFEGMERELEYIFSYVQHLANGQRPLFRGRTESKKEVPVGTYDQYVKYPKYALDNGIQGTVLVDFIIDEKGEVRDVKVSRGVHQSLDDEAVRVVSASPKWRPGRHRGKKTRVALTVAVEFRLTKEKGRFGINGKTIN